MRSFFINIGKTLKRVHIFFKTLSFDLFCTDMFGNENFLDTCPESIVKWLEVEMTPPEDDDYLYFRSHKCKYYLFRNSHRLHLNDADYPLYYVFCGSTENRLQKFYYYVEDFVRIVFPDPNLPELAEIFFPPPRQ